MKLRRYVGRRLLGMLPILLGISVLVFMLVHLIPGNPAVTILGNKATPERVALLNHQWGLDQSLRAQYANFLGRVLRGNLGQSLFYAVSVGSLVLQKVPITLFLIAYGGLLALIIA